MLIVLEFSIELLISKAFLSNSIFLLILHFFNYSLSYQIAVSYYELSNENFNLLMINKMTYFNCLWIVNIYFIANLKSSLSALFFNKSSISFLLTFISNYFATDPKPPIDYQVFLWSS